MIYIKSFMGGIVLSVVSVIIYTLIAALRHSGDETFVGIDIRHPLPLLILGTGFAAGFLFVFCFARRL